MRFLSKVKRGGGGRRRLGSVVLTLAFSLLTFAPSGLEGQQTGSLTGQVVNASSGAPLPAAQISLVGTNMGILSQANGRYLLLNVPVGSYTLRCDIIGFGAREVPVQVVAGSATAVDFSLSVEAISLDEMVVTGTAGASRRREIGNSVSSVDVTQLSGVKPATNVSDLLQGQVAGLTQFTTEGQPGAGTTIRIRGNNSVSQANTPLIYIDGVRMVSSVPPDEGSQQVTTALNLLNPDDIARIEVIKGAAATTLYGTEASSGVIQIFTKRGREGPAVWSMQTTQGLTKLTNNNFGPVVGDEPTWINIKPWVNDALMSKFNASVNGSRGNVAYYLSGEYTNEQGFFDDQYRKWSDRNGNTSQMTSFRANVSFEPLQGLQIAANSGYSHRFTNWAQSGDNRYGAVLNLMRSPKNYVSGVDSVVFNQRTQSIDDHFVGGITATYNPIASLTNRFTVGIDWRDGTNDWVIPKDHPIYTDGWRTENRWRHTTLTMDYVGSWRVVPLENVSSLFSFGGQVFSDYDHRMYGDTQIFSGPGLDQDLDSGTLEANGEGISRQVNAGFFLQEMIGWNDQLFVTGGIRVDGHSAFGADYGLQAYPKVSVAYVVSDLDFWPSWWDAMKIRAAMGESGKAPGIFDAVRTFSPSSGNEDKPGITPNNLGDPDLGPERTREIEFGFEGSAFDNRVSVDVSYYHAVTMDALVQKQFPPSLGFADPQLANIGEILNKGIELQLDVTPYRSEDLTVALSAQLATNKNEARDLGGEQIQLGGSASYRTWAREGTEVGAYYGSVVVTNPDAIADPVYATDKYIGPSYPTHNYGFSATVNFLKNFTLYALGEGAGGHFAFNGTGRQQQGSNRFLWPTCQVANPEAQNALWRAQCEDVEWTAYITPADYFKIRTMSLSYQIPEGVIPRTSQASFTFAVNNVWKFTDYPGLDPEITRGDLSLVRREYYQIPPGTQFSASLRVVF